MSTLTQHDRRRVATGSRKRRRDLALALAGCAASWVAIVEPAAAQTKVGTALAQFVGIEPGARFAAMGNAGVAADDGIQGVYFNPGTLGALDRPEAQLTHSEWFAGIDYNYAAIAYPLSFGTLFGSVTALNSGDIEVRTVSQPLGTGERYTVSNIAVSLGYGRHVTERFVAGAQVNYVNETIWHTTSDVFTFSFGATYRLTPSGVKLGASLSHVGTGSKFEGGDLAIQFDADPDEHGDNSGLPAEQFTDDFPVPILFRIGLSVPRELNSTNRLLLLVDAYHPSDNTESLSLGGEWSWKDALALRLGYQNLFQEDSELGLTAGAGLRSGIGDNELGLDYAWGAHEHLDSTHRVTVVLEF
jgi:long-subunit fatty acid transport protein